MYPFDDEDEELETEEEGAAVEEDDEDIPREFGVDFRTGRMTGGKVSGAKAVAVWAWNAIMYPRYRYEIATWNYGSELSDLIGRVIPKDELESQVDAMLRDAFLPNPYIEDISNLECTLDGDKLTISFTLETPFGEEDMNDVTIR